ncbi:hypothetical protein QP028_12800 [Corynebacterium suedekumii]|nr:hypothetical protein QP028_12800 [Corynebacterium suedekumii]
MSSVLLYLGVLGFIDGLNLGPIADAFVTGSATGFLVDLFTLGA